MAAICGRRAGAVRFPRARFWFYWFAAGLLGILLCRPGSVHAQPMAASSLTGGGYTLKIDSELGGMAGYRPLRLWLSAKPAPADRLLKVEFKVHTWIGVQETVETQLEIVLPAGSTLAQTSTLVPILGTTNAAHVVVREDGVAIPGLESWLSFSTPATGDPGSSLPCMLVIGDAKQVDSAVLAELIGMGMQSWRVFPGVINSAAQHDYPLLSQLPLEKLYDHWLAYSSLDLVCLSLADAQRAARQFPGVWAALRQWAAAGGNLVLTGVDSATDANRAASLLDYPQSDISADSDQPGAHLGWPAWRGWSAPAFKDYSDRISDAHWAAYYDAIDAGNVAEKRAADELSSQLASPADGGPDETGDTPLADQENPSANSAADDWEKEIALARRPIAPCPSEPPFLWRELGLGAVVVCRSPSLFPGTPEDWGWILNTLDPNRWLWYRRGGFCVKGANPDYWKFLIANLGQAPVRVFQVLISLFVLVIGPVNYWVLWRRRRLQLLVITTPLCALAVTGALFGYALVADGLHTRVRDRSLTCLVPSGSLAVCTARMSYYSGLTPWGGLVFPTDTAVTPLGPNGSVSVGARNSNNRSIQWSETQQRLVSGWLPSRTPTQLVTNRVRSSTLRLVIESASGTPSVAVNQLNCQIRSLLVKDATSAYFRGGAGAPGARVMLEPTDLATAARAGQETWRENQLLAPEGLDPVEASLSIRGRFWGNDEVEAQWSSSRMETVLRQALVDPDQLPPNRFVAVVDRSPEVVWGVRSAEDLGGLHVIVGPW